MIGVDANVLLRFLIADQPEFYARSTQFFKARTADQPAYICIAALLETFWTLKRFYRIEEGELIPILKSLLKSNAIVVEGREVLQLICDGYLPYSMMADALIAYSGTAANCSYTFTFDKRAASHISGMELLQ